MLRKHRQQFLTIQEPFWLFLDHFYYAFIRLSEVETCQLGKNKRTQILGVGTKWFIAEQSSYSEDNYNYQHAHQFILPKKQWLHTKKIYWLTIFVLFCFVFLVYRLENRHKNPFPISRSSTKLLLPSANFYCLSNRDDYSRHLHHFGFSLLQDHKLQLLCHIILL